MIEKCDKGLCEGWEEWDGDCSHAWAGTPAYMLKKALSGFEMIEARYKKVKLSPSLMGLEYANFEISTPYGAISVKMKKDEAPVVKSPKGINLVY